MHKAKKHVQHGKVKHMLLFLAEVRRSGPFS